MCLAYSTAMSGSQMTCGQVLLLEAVYKRVPAAISTIVYSTCSSYAAHYFKSIRLLPARQFFLKSELQSAVSNIAS